MTETPCSVCGPHFFGKCPHRYDPPDLDGILKDVVILPRADLERLCEAAESLYNGTMHGVPQGHITEALADVASALAAVREAMNADK